MAAYKRAAYRQPDSSDFIHFFAMTFDFLSGLKKGGFMFLLSVGLVACDGSDTELTGTGHEWVSVDEMSSSMDTLDLDLCPAGATSCVEPDTAQAGNIDEVRSDFGEYSTSEHCGGIYTDWNDRMFTVYPDTIFLPDGSVRGGAFLVTESGEEIISIWEPLLEWASNPYDFDDLVMVLGEELDHAVNEHNHDLWDDEHFRSFRDPEDACGGGFLT